MKGTIRFVVLRSVGCALVLACVSVAVFGQTEVFSDNFDRSPFDFESMPGWQSSSPDAGSDTATWSIVPGGQSGNFLQASRTDNGQSARTLRYDIATNTDYTISIYIRCSGADPSYWAETAYRLGDYSAQDFIDNWGNWTQIQRFSDSGTNGNGGVWTQYTADFNSGANTKVSLGFKLGASATSAPVVQWDTLVAGWGGVVSAANWTVVPGKVSWYSLNQLIGSEAGHKKNHTGSPGGQMGDPTTGGAAFEVDAQPYPYASYHEFDPQTGILRLSTWVWEDAERPLCTAVAGFPVRGMVGLTSLPGEQPIVTNNCSSPNEVYPYDDFAFIGVNMTTSDNPNDPPQKFYQWRTKTDGWHLTTVPRKVDYVCHGDQTWRHVEIVAHPYSGQVGDIQFFIDGVLVGEGQREPGTNCQGVPFRRIQLGTRFPEGAPSTDPDPDASICRPTYSYEHFWFDDVLLTTEPAGLPCPNPQLRFDADDDGDVDQLDFSVFQACFTGANDPAGIYDCQACRCMNSDNDTPTDTDIDGDDLAAFEQCASGPGVAADVTCDDLLAPP
jgi:hypothetical protein